MARYIDADLIPYSDDDDYLSQYAYRYDINEVPTADVVPKSEVDLYRKQVDELEDELASTYDKLEDAKSEYDNLKMQFDALDCECDRLEKAESEKYDKFIEAKADVAREIFEEIDNKIGIGHDVIDIFNILDELKKKYTGEKT